MELLLLHFRIDLRLSLMVAIHMPCSTYGRITQLLEDSIFNLIAQHGCLITVQVWFDAFDEVLVAQRLVKCRERNLTA